MYISNYLSDIKNITPDLVLLQYSRVQPTEGVNIRHSYAGTSIDFKKHKNIGCFVLMTGKYYREAGTVLR